jgi:hypothetical protein
MCRENIPPANGTDGVMDNYADNEALDDWRQLRTLRCLLTRREVVGLGGNNVLVVKMVIKRGR